MKISFVLFLMCLALNSCNKHSVKSEKSDIKVNPIDSLLPSDCIPSNFVTSMGTKIIYTKVDHAVKLSWGDGVYTRSHDSLFNCMLDSAGLWDFIPKYNSETKNHLVFTKATDTSGGGNPDPIEFCVMIFPKNVNDSIYEKNYFLDKHDDYIMYLPKGWAGVLEILNVETGKSQQCILDPQPVHIAKSPTWIISKTEVSGKSLKIEYEWLDADDNEVIRKNKFKLKV